MKSRKYSGGLQHTTLNEVVFYMSAETGYRKYMATNVNLWWLPWHGCSLFWPVACYAWSSTGGPIGCCMQHTGGAPWKAL